MRTKGFWELKQPRGPCPPPRAQWAPAPGAVRFRQGLSAAETSSLAASSPTPAASDSLYFSRALFLKNQIYIFKNPSDNHEPKKLALLWGLIRRSCLSGISESLAPNFSEAREGLWWMSGSEWNRGPPTPHCNPPRPCNRESCVAGHWGHTATVLVSSGPGEWGRSGRTITH